MCCPVVFAHVIKWRVLWKTVCSAVLCPNWSGQKLPYSERNLLQLFDQFVSSATNASTSHKASLFTLYLWLQTPACYLGMHCYFGTLYYLNNILKKICVYVFVIHFLNTCLYFIFTSINIYWWVLGWMYMYMTHMSKNVLHIDKCTYSRYICLYCI